MRETKDHKDFAETTERKQSFNLPGCVHERKKKNKWIYISKIFPTRRIRIHSELRNPLEYDFFFFKYKKNKFLQCETYRYYVACVRIAKDKSVIEERITFKKKKTTIHDI